MKRCTCLVSWVLLTVALLLGGCGGAHALTIKFGHIAPTFHGQSKGIDAFAQYVKEKTNGEIEVQAFPFGQLGNETSLTEQVQTGTLEIASITTAVLQSYFARVAIPRKRLVLTNFGEAAN